MIIVICTSSPILSELPGLWPQETETGFIEEHRVFGELPDGNQLNLAACVVGTVEDGKISALREYVDTGAAIGLMKALQ